MKVLLKSTVNIFKLVGYWPLETKNSKILLIYKLYFYLNMTIFILLTLSVWLEVPNAVRSGLKKLVSSLPIAAQFTNCGIKLLCLSLPFMRNLYHEATVIEDDILESKSDSVKAIYRKHIKMNKKLNNGLFAASLVNAFAFTITPLIMEMSDPNNDEMSLPLPCYFPFNYGKNYKIAFLLTVIGGTVISIYFVACNMTYISWMIFIISQLAILKQEIVEGIDKSRFSDVEVYQNLRQVVIRYRNISKFVSDLNKVVKFLNLLYFLLCIAYTSMIGFEVITDTFSFQLVRNIWYLVANLSSELFTWYWFGNKITSQHSATLDAIWESDWYNCSIRNKKAILIIIMQVQKPLRLSVGYTYSMSLETMSKILKMSMSYTMTLKQFYVTKEVNNQ